jgi:hypothetical protein
MAVSAPFGAAEYLWIWPVRPFVAVETCTYATGEELAGIAFDSVGEDVT